MNDIPTQRIANRLVILSKQLQRYFYVLTSVVLCHIPTRKLPDISVASPVLGRPVTPPEFDM